jgi:hypothetical protein
MILQTFVWDLCIWERKWSETTLQIWSKTGPRNGVPAAWHWTSCVLPTNANKHHHMQKNATSEIIHLDLATKIHVPENCHIKFAKHIISELNSCQFYLTGFVVLSIFSPPQYKIYYNVTILKIICLFLQQGKNVVMILDNCVTNFSSYTFIIYKEISYSHNFIPLTSLNL